MYGRSEFLQREKENSNYRTSHHKALYLSRRSYFWRIGYCLFHAMLCFEQIMKFKQQPCNKKDLDLPVQVFSSEMSIWHNDNDTIDDK